MLACHNYWHWALFLIEKVGEPLGERSCSPADAVCHTLGALTVAQVSGPWHPWRPGFWWASRPELLSAFSSCWVLGITSHVWFAGATETCYSERPSPHPRDWPCRNQETSQQEWAGAAPPGALSQ